MYAETYSVNESIVTIKLSTVHIDLGEMETQCERFSNIKLFAQPGGRQSSAVYKTSARWAQFWCALTTTHGFSTERDLYREAIFI